MKINSCYPSIEKKIKQEYKIYNIVCLMLTFSALTCIIINISVGGKPWSLLVVGGGIIFYLIFVYKPLIDNLFIRRFTYTIFAICGYLYLIDYVEGTSWSSYVIKIICFSVLIVQTIFLFTFYNKQKVQMIPIFLTTILSIIIAILALCGLIILNWPLIVFGSIGTALLIIFFTILRKNFIKELKKYFYIK
ncbi:MAG TPA: DUF6320 domain-containing protein [Bacilli bacterium]|nr:DUF6320 domain-containing protein [Bacilli bacterium]